MSALELVSGFTTAPGAALTAVTVAAGNSLSVRATPFDTDIRLLQVWVDSQVAGQVQIRSPRLHDNVRNFTVSHVVSEVQPLFPLGKGQPLVTQDTLVALLSGSAVAGDIESLGLLIWYADLPGILGRFLGPDEVMERMCNLLTVENVIATGIAGGYSGEEALNAESDLLKANTDYALLGYHVNAECASVRWRGVDLGNLGVGGPGNEVDKHLTGNWFLRLSREHNLPLIPVFNSQNKSGILVDAVQDENGVDVTLHSILCELGPAGAGG